MTDKQTILVGGATGNIGGGAAVALAKLGDICREHSIILIKEVHIFIVLINNGKKNDCYRDGIDGYFCDLFYGFVSRFSC